MAEDIADIHAEKNESTESSISDRTQFHTDVNDMFQNNSFCWENVSVWGKQKETQGLWRRTSYRDFQIVKKGRFKHQC